MLAEVISSEREVEVDLIDLLERAERMQVEGRDDKYWATRDEIMALIAEEAMQEPKIYQGLADTWIIEIVHQGITFIHATHCHLFTGETIH